MQNPYTRKSMKCNRCAFVNEPDARFCENCGEALEQTCPNCGQPVKPGAKFCKHCGFKLSLSSAPDANSAASVVEGKAPARLSALQHGCTPEGGGEDSRCAGSQRR